MSYIMKRCVSICQGMKEEDCTEPCTFVGKKYCRLSTQYKMDPPGCEVTKKEGKVKPKTQTKPATKPVANRVMEPVAEPSIEPKSRPKTRAKTKKRVSIVLPESKLNSGRMSVPRLARPWTLKNSAARTIQTFMKRTEGKRKALFYGTICSDSGACIALGKEKQKLLDFFKFDTFENAKEFKSIGGTSVNGFLKEITYEREGYTAHAILKSSSRDGSDSLAYEYLVGQFINQVGKRFPGFVETYGLYHYPNTELRDTMKTKDTLVKKLIPFDPQNIRDVCRKAKNICTLIQHIQRARSFFDHYEDDSFRDHESAYVYYQVFFTLHQLRTEFTHYDLHRNNVLLYEPVVGKYIQYHYHLPDRIIRYKSKYLVKIIDYGRSFFPGALDYHQRVCAEKACDPLCGLRKGFSTFHEDRRYEIVSGGMNTLYKNESHDLIFLHDSKGHLDYLQKPIDPEYRQILEDTLYNQGISTRMGQWGTMEDLKHDTKIRNVTDAYQRWEKYILKRGQMNDADHDGLECLGDLHVYPDRDLEYVPYDPLNPVYVAEPYVPNVPKTKTKPKSRARSKSKAKSKTNVIASVQGIRI